MDQEKLCIWILFTECANKISNQPQKIVKAPSESLLFINGHCYSKFELFRDIRGEVMHNLSRNSFMKVDNRGGHTFCTIHVSK